MKKYSMKTSSTPSSSINQETIWQSEIEQVESSSSKAKNKKKDPLNLITSPSSSPTTKNSIPSEAWKWKNRSSPWSGFSLKEDTLNSPQPTLAPSNSGNSSKNQRRRSSGRLVRNLPCQNFKLLKPVSTPNSREPFPKNTQLRSTTSPSARTRST